MERAIHLPVVIQAEPRAKPQQSSAAGSHPTGIPSQRYLSSPIRGTGFSSELAGFDLPVEAVCGPQGLEQVCLRNGTWLQESGDSFGWDEIVCPPAV